MPQISVKAAPLPGKIPVADDSALLFDQAAAHLNHGRYTEALSLFARLLSRHPAVAELYEGQGRAFSGLEKLPEALQSFDRALALQPANIRSLYGRAVTLDQLGRLEACVAGYSQVLLLCPDLAEAHNRRGVAHQRLARFAEAMADYDRAIALIPVDPEYFYNRATCLGAQQHFEEALADYDQAIALRADLFAARSNRAQALVELNRVPDALCAFDEALALVPGHPHTTSQKALALLSLGNFREGLALYEARRSPRGPIRAPALARPHWSGAEALAGKTLLLHAEQGLGDIIQFCRYAKLAAARGAEIFLAAPAKLMRLLYGLSSAVQMVDQARDLPDCDYQAMLMSLPLAFGTRMELIPAEPAYLFAEPARTKRWNARIGDHGFRIGLAWHGDILPNSDHRRTLPLAQLAALAQIPDVRLISLQKGAGTEQLQNLPAGMVVETLDADFDEGPDAFLDTAAVMQSLDLVISSDTAVAHLAGALGRPVWVALRQMPDWRWFAERRDSPWYPTMRLFRQKRRDDWTSVFDDMTQTLAEKVS